MRFRTDGSFRLDSVTRVLAWSLLAAALLALLRLSSRGPACDCADHASACVASSSSASHTGLPGVQHRDQLGELLQRLGLKVGAELGVQRGVFAEVTLRNWPGCDKYYLVDVWGQQKNYADIANVDDAAQQQLFEETQQRLAPWKEKIEFLRMYTSEAAPRIPDESLDYVYVDARHDYCGTMEDMELYWPKLKRGGVLAGHDYLHGSDPLIRGTGQDWSLCMNGTRNEGAVKGAVDEFAAKHSLVISVTYKDGDWPSWLTRKP